MGVDIPQDIRNVGFASGNKPVVAFFAVDRISTTEDDTINYVLVCKNEGDSSGDNACVFKAMSNKKILYEDCGDRVDLDGGVKDRKGITICSGHFDMSEAGDGLYLMPYTSNGNEKRSLLVLLPAQIKEKGILVVFNNPGLKEENNIYSMNYHHPVVDGDHPSRDYGEYDWILTGLKGVKDDFGNKITKYVVNTRAFLKGEGVLIYPNVNAANVKVGVSLINASDIKLQENYLKNPGFETGTLSDWKIGKGSWVVSSQKYTRDYSAHLTSSDFGKDYYIYQKIPVKPNKKYEIFGYIKTENVVKGVNGKGAVIHFIVRNSTNNDISGTDTYIGYLNGTKDWTPVGKTIESKNGAFINIWLQVHNASGDVWFDDISVKEVSDSKGRVDGTIFWLHDDSDHNVKIVADDEEESFSIKTEPSVRLTYHDEELEGDVIADEETSFTRVLEISSESEYRPQVISLDPNISLSNYVEDSCHVDTGSCWDDFIVSPGKSYSKKFSWKEDVVKLQIVQEKQDMTKQSTVDRQYMLMVVNLTNTDPNRDYRVKAAVYTDGICSDWRENYKNMYWISRDMRSRFCYISTRLDPLESRIFNLSYYGDWVDFECGEIKQDMSKQSTLERQYLVKECELKSEKKISWKDILVSTDMPGNCSDCVQNVSIAIPVLWLTFDEGEGNITYDKSGFGNDGIIHGAKWVEGKFGKALEFDGVDDYVEIDSIFLQDKMTINLWIKINSSTDHKQQRDVLRSDKGFLVRIRHDPHRHIEGWIWTDKGKFSVMGGDKIGYNEWHQITMVCSGNNLTTYLDGKIQGNRSLNGTLNFNNKIFISRFDNTFPGTIDEVIIYDQALDDEEIKELSNELEFLKSTIFLVHSSVNWLSKKMTELNTSHMNDKIVLIQRLEINNTSNIDLFNISIKISIPWDIINVTVLNSTEIKVSSDNLLFKIPKINKKSKNNIYDIIFLPRTSDVINENHILHKTSSKTGMFVKYLENSRNIFEYISLILLTTTFVVMSYFYHKFRG